MDKFTNYFTNYYYRLPSTGELEAPPETPPGHTAVQYMDSGYHGGEYWAILPLGWTASEAVKMFLDEEHITELVEIDHKPINSVVVNYGRFFKGTKPGKVPVQVLYDLRELTGFVSGTDLHSVFVSLLGEPSPSGYKTVSRKEVLRILNGYKEFESEIVFVDACERHYFSLPGTTISREQAKSLWRIVKTMRKPKAYAKFVRKANRK